MSSCTWFRLLSLTLLLLHRTQAKPRIKIFFPDEDELEENSLKDSTLPSIYKKLVIPITSWNETKSLDLNFDMAKLKCTGPSETFCEEVDESLYPTEYLEELLKQKSYQRYFNDIKIGSVQNKLNEELSLRMNKPFSMAIEFCKSKIRTIYPKIAMTTENDWSYVINQHQFRQAIHVETCEYSDTPCLFSNLFPIGYKTRCKQKFMKQSLLGLDRSGNLQAYLYRFPSHCQCELFF